MSKDTKKTEGQDLVDAHSERPIRSSFALGLAAGFSFSPSGSHSPPSRN